MDVSKFKDVIRKLSILKAYSTLLLPVAIVLVGVLVFIPTQLMSGRLRKQMVRESVSMGRKIQTLRRTAVARDQWEVEQDYQRAYENDANGMVALVRQSSQRQLLSYKIFPEPKDTSTRIFEEFGRQFCREIEGLVARVNGRDCPTDAELARGLRGSSLPGRKVGRRRSSRNSGEVEATITDALCRAKAESASVYVNPADLSGYEFWGQYRYAGMGEAVKDCWYWQIGYWIVEDIIDTIAACNSGSNSVFNSPVKRLMTVNFAGSGSRSRKGIAQGRPSYVLSIDGEFTRSLTGRHCSDDIDVVHFNVAVVVSAEAVLPFMQQLCSARKHKFKGFFGDEPEQSFRHNQIAILESNITSIVQESEEHGLYRYGEDAVVKLDLVCEYIFNKSGYGEIKPELVKKELGS